MGAADRQGWRRLATPNRHAPRVELWLAAGALLGSLLTLAGHHYGALVFSGREDTSVLTLSAQPDELSGVLPEAPAGQACLLATADPDWASKLPEADHQIFSQNGEDGILLAIFRNIGVLNRQYVELGTEDGKQCNTRALRELLGWRGLLLDGGHEDPGINLRKEFITGYNINELFEKYSVPHEFDLLSIGIDYDDWFVWMNLMPHYRPRVVVVEHNSAIPLNELRAVDPADERRWRDGNCYFGASLGVMEAVGRSRGYHLVAVDRNGVNAFFVRSDILECQGVQPLPMEQLYRSAQINTSPEADTSRKWLFFNDQMEELKREYVDCRGHEERSLHDRLRFLD